MRGQHRTVVHLVDVIAGEHEHVPRMMQLDDLQVLVERVGGPAIPEVAELLLRRNDFDELAELAAQVAPTALDVLDQRMRLVLRHDRDPPDARIDAVREDEVDDAELAAERRRRLAAMVGEMFQALAAAARHDDGERMARDPADIPPRRGGLALAERGPAGRYVRCSGHVRNSRSRVRHLPVMLAERCVRQCMHELACPARVRHCGKRLAASVGFLKAESTAADAFRFQRHRPPSGRPLMRACASCLPALFLC